MISLNNQVIIKMLEQQSNKDLDTIADKIKKLDISVINS